MMTTEEFKRIFLPCAEQMYLLALRLTDSKADAEDAVQDVFVRLWHGRGGLKFVGNPQAYAITMTRNRALDIIAARHPASPLDTISEPTDEEVSDALIEALNSLPATQRLVMELRYRRELPMEEIERQTGLSQGNLRVILSRARNAIKKRFKHK